MNSVIYLVMEYDNRKIYLPFKSLKDVDDYTSGFDNPLELVATTGSILELDIPNEEILDAYLSLDIDKIDDDMQEYNARYLAIKYRKDDYVKSDLERNFIKYTLSNINYGAFDIFKGLENIYSNYVKKHASGRKINEKDITRIALLYLENNYKRQKECYFILKDNNYKTKTRGKNITYSAENIKKMLEEDKLSLVNGTGMNIPELQECINRQNEGRIR